MKASKQEPAPRTVAMTLSVAEAIALVHYHVREAKACTRRYGAAAMQLNTEIMPKGRQLQALHEATTANVNAHTSRAQEILNFTKNTAPKIA